MEPNTFVRVLNAGMTIASMCSLSIALAVADDWPQWRGPKRDNKSLETGLLKSWPEKGPPLDWQVDGLGDGIASLAIADGRIFTSTSYGNAEYAVALDVQTGHAKADSLASINDADLFETDFSQASTPGLCPCSRTNESMRSSCALQILLPGPG